MAPVWPDGERREIYEDRAPLGIKIGTVVVVLGAIIWSVANCLFIAPIVATVGLFLVLAVGIDLRKRW